MWRVYAPPTARTSIYILMYLTTTSQRYSVFYCFVSSASSFLPPKVTISFNNLLGAFRYMGVLKWKAHHCLFIVWNSFGQRALRSCAVYLKWYCEGQVIRKLIMSAEDHKTFWEIVGLSFAQPYKLLNALLRRSTPLYSSSALFTQTTSFYMDVESNLKFSSTVRFVLGFATHLHQTLPSESILPLCTTSAVHFLSSDRLLSIWGGQDRYTLQSSIL